MGVRGTPGGLLALPDKSNEQATKLHGMNDATQHRSS